MRGFLTILALIFFVFCCSAKPIEVEALPMTEQEILHSAYQATVSVRNLTKFRITDKRTKTSTIVETNFSGTGFVIENIENYSVILSAAHVCMVILDEQLPSQFNPEIHTLEHKSYIGLKDTNNNKHIAIPMLFNKEEDVCLLISTRIITPPILLSNNFPKIGDRIYILGFPKGIGSDGIGGPIITEGFYSGPFEINGKIAEGASFTITSGSSGSAVINKKGEAIGIAILVDRRFESFGYFVPLKTLWAAYGSYLEHKRNDIKAFNRFVKKIHALEASVLSE